MSDSDTLELWSSIFMSEDCNSSASLSTCSLEKSAWIALMNRRDHEDSHRLFAKIDYEEKTLYLALGSYTDCPSSESEHTRLILPQWALDVLSAGGTGDLAVVTWMTEEAFPSASRIVLRPHDSAFYHTDAKEELELALTRIGVLQKGQTIMVSLQSLDDYRMSFDVVDLEPANIVLADGEEVVLEFEAALDAPPEPVERPATPLPEVNFGPLLPVPTPAPTVIVTGRTTGGANRYTADGRPWNPHRDP
jgi:hypothetical protein